MSSAQAAPHGVSATSRADAGLQRWEGFALFLCVGYLVLGRSFAYLGFPPAKVFIGEIALAAFLFVRWRDVTGRWLGAMVAPTPLTTLAWAIGMFFAYGCLEFARGTLRGYDPFSALLNLAYSYYPIFLIVGVWLGGARPALLRRIVWWVAVINGVYGTLWVLLLGHSTATIPGSNGVLLFGQPGGSAIALLGLLAFEQRLSRILVPSLLNAFVLLGIQVRAEWLGFAAALGIWGVLTGKLRRVAWAAAVVLAIVVAGFFADVRLPSPSSRGGVISVREIVARGLAPVRPDLASELSSSDQNVKFYAGTFAWRIGWWIAIWEHVHADGQADVRLFGEGYGFPLWELVNYVEENVRTPHNIFFYALAYGGWTGVALLVLLHIAIVQQTLAAYRLTRNPFGLAMWAFAVVMALFGNILETPLGAIPLYLLLGLAIAPVAAAADTVPARTRHALGPVPSPAG